jgi:hypothetical protein
MMNVLVVIVSILARVNYDNSKSFFQQGLFPSLMVLLVKDFLKSVVDGWNKKRVLVTLNLAFVIIVVPVLLFWRDNEIFPYIILGFCSVLMIILFFSKRLSDTIADIPSLIISTVNKCRRNPSNNSSATSPASSPTV